jgi:hypothetical protein
MATDFTQPAGNGPPPAAGASRLSPQGWGWPESDPYQYPLNSPTIAGGATGQAQLQLDTDADFLWDRINAAAFQGGTHSWAVYLQDASRGVPLIGSPLAPLGQVLVGGNGAITIAGNASLSLPFWLPKPYYLRRGTILAATFYNLLAEQALQVQLVLTGRKVPPR